jgi:hypothetical protein
MGVAERDDEAIAQLQGLVKAHESARAVAQVAHVIAPVFQVVLDDHVSAADPVVILVHHKVVLNLAILVVHLRADYRAAIVLASQRSLHATRVDLYRDVLADIRTLDCTYPKNVCLVDLVLWDDHASHMGVSKLRVGKGSVLLLVVLSVVWGLA